jgi:hypothetical protein
MKVRISSGMLPWISHKEVSQLNRHFNSDLAPLHICTPGEFGMGRDHRVRPSTGFHPEEVKKNLWKG